MIAQLAMMQISNRKQIGIDLHDRPNAFIDKRKSLSNRVQKFFANISEKCQ